MQCLSGPMLSLLMIDANCHYTGYVYCGPVSHHTTDILASVKRVKQSTN